MRMPGSYRTLARYARRVNKSSVLGLVLALGCGSAVTTSARFDLSVPLASIDPGPSVPLVLDVPGPDRASLLALPDTTGDLETYADQLRRTASSIEPARILRAALLLEARVGASCDFRCARSLATFYGLLVTMREVSDAVLRLDGSLAPLLSRIPQRDRWATATALRETTDLHLRAEVLLQHAVALSASGDHAHARALQDAALLALAEATSDAADADVDRAHDVENARAGRARACYALGDAVCGDADLEGVRASGAAAARIEGLERARDAAVAVRETEGDPSIDAQLRRADALVELDDRDGARTILESLTQNEPTDARPHTRLALLGFERVVLAMAAGAPLDDIAAHLRAASWLEHRDETYYELRTIMWQFEALRVMTESERRGHASDPGALSSDVDPIAEGLAEADPGTAAAFRVWAAFLLRLLAGGTAGLEADMQQGAQEAIAARARFPTNLHLARVALLLGVSAGAEPTREAITPPLPELADVIVATRYLAAIHYNDPGLLPESANDPELGALLLAERARTGLTPWPDVAAAYRRLLADASAVDRARLANGLAVALFASGQIDEARGAIASVDGDIAQLNRLAMSATTPPATNWLDAVRRLASETTTPHVACLATGLLVHFGAALTSDRDARCVDVHRHVGVDLSADTLFSFDYSRGRGLTSDFRVPITVWLLAELDPEGW